MVTTQSEGRRNRGICEMRGERRKVWYQACGRKTEKKKGQQGGIISHPDDALRPL